MKTTPGETLQQKVIVITGASSGAGRAAAIEFARKQAILVLAARNEEALAGIARECEALGAKTHIVRTDVTDPEAVKNLADAAVTVGGRIDVWINNAGVLAVGAFEETPVDIHAQVIRTNLIGYVYGAHAVLPYFIKQGYGILMNNISVGGWYPVPYGTAYSASKFGIRGFSEALRGELIRFPHIHVCNLFPAFLDSPGTQHAANFTGAALKPAPPVYDPLRVGRAMVRLAMHPRNSVTIGSVAPLLRFAHFAAPGLSLAITARVMETFFKNADCSPHTSGNLFEPLTFGTSIHGGWNSAADIDIRKKRLGKGALLLAGLVALVVIAKK